MKNLRWIATVAATLLAVFAYFFFIAGDNAMERADLGDKLALIHDAGTITLVEVWPTGALNAIVQRVSLIGEQNNAVVTEDTSGKVFRVERHSHDKTLLNEWPKGVPRSRAESQYDDRAKVSK